MKTFFFFFWRTPQFGQKNRSNFRKDLFFFFFGEHLNLDRKTVQISGKTFFFFFFGEHLNLGRKKRLNFDRETQCIKSFFGQKFAAPPNHFELLRPWFLGKRFRALAYRHSRKQQWRVSATSFKELLFETYRESHFYGKLIMMSIPAIHISYNLEHFIRSSCEGSKKISNSFRWRNN